MNSESKSSKNSQEKKGIFAVVRKPFNEFFADRAYPGLSSYCLKTRQGNSDVVRAPFANKTNPQKVLDEWFPHLKKLASKWPTLVDFEEDLRSKVGPLSVQQPLSKRTESIESYFTDIHLDQVDVDRRALQSVVNEFRAVSGLKVRDQYRTVDNMKLSTSSGNPYFTKRRTIVRQTLPVELNDSGLQPSQYLNVGYKSGQQWPAAAILGWRGQEGGPSKNDVKQRVVWMFPFGVNVGELSVYQPFIEACQEHDLVSPWVGEDAVNKKMTKLFDTKGTDDLVICTDFTKFDQHFNNACQQGAFYILSYLLSSDLRTSMWTMEDFWLKYNIPLVVDIEGDNVVLYYGQHGMASGSGGTNCDETLLHRALQHEAALLHGSQLNPNSMCLGDDGVLSYPGITVEDVLQTYTSHGLEMNESKQYVSTQDCVFLRKWYHKDYRIDGICTGVYSTCRALGRLMYQERFYDPDVWGPETVALRQLSIIENCKYHPLRVEFAKFCMTKDKYRLGLDLPNFLANIDKIAKEKMDVLPDFLSYSQSVSKQFQNEGMKSWWIVRYLNSLR